MAILTVNSQMDAFRLIQSITGIWTGRMQAIASFTQVPVFAGLEAMAQLAALHVRHRLNFCKHVFLLTIRHCDVPVGESLHGKFTLMADSIGQSSQSFAYHVSAHDSAGTTLQTDLLIGSQDYDERFREEKLAQHYKDIFNALRKPNCQ